MSTPEERIAELETAANEWFAAERARLEAEYAFLDAISKKRGGKLQKDNAQKVADILANDLNEYLNEPQNND